MANASTSESGAMQSQAVRLLKNKRRSFKAQLTSFGNSLETYEDSAKERVKLRERIERLRKQFDNFNEIQDELGLIEDFLQTQTERDAVTAQYDEVIATAITILREAEHTPTQLTTTAMRSINDSPALSSSSAAIGVHLPKIDLPKFDGRLEKWVAFKDSFSTMIHSHPGLTDIQKLHYLRLSLSGKAESAMESFTISEDNYRAAWDQLNETYDNTRALVLRHSTLLRDTPAMIDDSAESIRDMINHMQSHIRSLNALGRSWADIANDLVASIAISKMSPGTKRDWEQTLNDTNMPKIADIFRHLRNASHRCRTETLPTNSSSSFENRASAAAGAPSHHFHVKRSPVLTRKTTLKKPSSPQMVKKQTFTTTTQSSCKICKSNTHPAYQCKQFLDMVVSERLQAAREANLCSNCLLGDHAAKNCNGGKCRVCHGHHNTLLHRDTSPREEVRKT